jgi:hypothetical protein
MENKNSIMVLFAFTFQMTMFGLGFREMKIFGDIILIILLASIIKNHKNVKADLENDAGRKYILINKIFVVYVIFQMLYTIVSWGEVILPLQQGRRWLIVGIYMALVYYHYYHPIFNEKILRIGLFTFIGVTVFSLFLVRSGIELPSADYTEQEQGGLIVFKPFIPGTILLYFIVINFALIALRQENIVKKILLVFSVIPLLLVTAYLIPFRGWISITIFSIIAAIFLQVVAIKKIKLLLLPIVLILVVGYLVKDQLEDRITWVTSAVDEFENVDNNYKFRYLNDISKIAILDQNSRYTINGLGFIHKYSKTAEIIGFSTETNDTGWVEVVLTSGLLGSTIVVVWYTSILFFYLFQYFKYQQIQQLVGFSIWLMAGILMISSNLIFWDFGFVPITLMLLLHPKYQFNDAKN